MCLRMFFYIDGCSGAPMTRTNTGMIIVTFGIDLPPGACEKVASDLGFGLRFPRVLRFPPPLTNGYSRQNSKSKSKLVQIRECFQNIFDIDVAFLFFGKRSAVTFDNIKIIS